jgi:gliding motility-associated-like protein
VKNTFRRLLFALILFPFAHVIAQTDCPDAIIVCGNSNYTGLNATGIGTQELNINNACSSQEHNSLWLKILIKDGGTLGFILTPESDDLVVDFDFWMYGPNVECGALGTAIRCSTTNPGAAGLDFNHTGMNGTETDVSEGPGPDGNAYINWINVSDDDIYYLVIDRPHGEANFSMVWTGTATFHEIPAFLNPDDIPLEIVECDDDGVHDERTAFDLTVFAEMFIGPQTDIALTYHLDINDMTTGDDPLDNPEAFVNTSDPQTIYMRLTNTVTGCYDTETLVISVDTSISMGEPEDLSLCDTNNDGFREFDLTGNDNAISNGNANTVVTYYASQANAQNEVDPFPALYTNQGPYTTETIWARLETTSGCYRYGIASFTISIDPQPEMMRTDDFPPDVPLAIVECDDDNVDNNSTTFDLTVFEPMLIGGQTNVELTYHRNSTDMETGEEAITNPLTFTNTSNPQIIYLRMTNTVTGCFSHETLTLSIDHDLHVGEPAPLLLCDIDRNGIREFNLTQNEAAIKDGNTNSTVTYYASEEDAENKVSPLTSLYENLAPNTVETIWARLDNTTGCFRHGITSFTITVLPLPEMMRNADHPEGMPLGIVKCDNDGIDDGSVAFDLTVFEEMLIGTQAGVTLSYHLNDDDMLTGDDPIVAPGTFSNTSSPQTIYLRMVNTATGCFTNELLTISIDPDLPAGVPDALSLCDTDGTGIREFDLTHNDLLISNGNVNTIVTYYASEEDAENEVSPLPTAYQNQEPYTTETIWARFQNTDGCFGFGFTSFTITVNELPEMLRNDAFPEGTPLEIVKCDDDGVHDGSVAFDLTVFEEMLKGPQANVALTYHLNSDDVQSGENAIDNPTAFANTANPQTIYLRMTNTATDCYTTETVAISLDLSLPIGTPQTLLLCDTDQNGIQQFDLRENDEAIQDGNANTVVTYYASEEDAENEVDPLPGIYQNQLPYVPGTIWARLETITGCYGFNVTSFTIDILPLPEMLRNANFPAGTPLEIVSCDDDGIHDGSVEFDLTVFEAMLKGSQANAELTYYADADDALSGENAIASPEAYANTSDPQIIYMRMSNTATGCFETESLTLSIDYTLPVGEPLALSLCDIEGDGFRQFDLSENDAAIKDGNSNSIVTYYASEEDAVNKMNPLPRLYQNQLPYTTETIWARLENITGCYGYGFTSFTIDVLAIPEINYTVDVEDFTQFANSITISMPGIAIENYEFSLDGSTFSDISIFDGLVPGLYTLTIRSKDGCSTTSDKIPVLNYPKFFTPNGDGINEVWNVYYIYFFPDAIINIFDRYGKLVKSYRGKDLGWDGTYNGERLPSTDYWFEVTFTSGRKIKSHFSLIR